MLNLRFSDCRRFAIVRVLLICFIALNSPLEAQDQSNQSTPAETQDRNPFQLKATSNLVVVRVVVRDAQGKPVEGLRKEDFRLFDQGKEQSISQFEVETSAAPASGMGAVPTPGKVAPPGQVAQPVQPAATFPKFIALNFDVSTRPMQT